MSCRQSRKSLRFAAGCWNWKCALMSAGVRSLVYLAAMTHGGLRGRLLAVAVEIVYVTLTAGFYAGLQQKALRFGRRWLGDLTIVVLVPGLSQCFDWLAHRLSGAAASGRATFAVCLFSLISALFHLYVMRRGVFLTGAQGRSLAEDFRRIPRLVASFVVLPATFVLAWAQRMGGIPQGGSAA